MIGDDLIFYDAWCIYEKLTIVCYLEEMLKPESQSWANYFVKFIKSYENEGIPVWGITIQNEPIQRLALGVLHLYSSEERDFLKFFLGPIKRNGLYKNIVVWDHNRDLISHRANTIFNDSIAMSYAWGIGFHWYETWTG